MNKLSKDETKSWKKGNALPEQMLNFIQVSDFVWFRKLIYFELDHLQKKTHINISFFNILEGEIEKSICRKMILPIVAFSFMLIK